MSGDSHLILPVPNLRNFTPGTLVDWIDTTHIDLETEYQRDIVWNTRKMSVLINSFLNNFYIPPVILSKTKRRVGETERLWAEEDEDVDVEYEEVYLCVDGKQRLTSFYKFMRNEIPSLEPDEKTRGLSRGVWFDDDKGGTRKVLSRVQRGWFHHRTLIVVEYDALTSEMEHELFNRVQNGMPLTPAEKVNAFSGPIADFVHELVDSYPQVLTIILTRRKEHIFLISKLVFVIAHEGECKCPSAPDIQTFMKTNKPPLTARYKNHIHRVFSLYADMITADKQFFGKEWRLTPVEYCMFGLLIFLNPELTVDDLFVAGRKMRDGVRQCYQELRFRTDVYKVLKVFATTLNVGDMVEEFRKLKPAFMRVQGVPLHSPAGKGSSASSTYAVEDDEDEDDDYEDHDCNNSNGTEVKDEQIRKEGTLGCDDSNLARFSTVFSSDAEKSSPTGDEEVIFVDEGVALPQLRQLPGRRRRASNANAESFSDEEYRPTRRVRRR
ncbi:hypothetical protein HK102_005171 [Quaeritorhiza haematococci]|nr:hypothetical protein HK102_005171 [Quaeritorhiza haematococci]